MWKASKYNVMTNFKDKIAMHNILTHQGILINKNDSYRVEEVLANPDKHIDEKIFCILCEKGFILKDDVDEIQLVEEMKYKHLEEKKKVLALTIIPTYQCNFKCIYCWENTKNQNDNMDEEAQKKFIKFVNEKIKDVSSLDIDWFGGEPLLAYDVMQNLLLNIDCICKENKKPYACALTSNGYALTEDKVRFLIKYHTHFFQITLDGNKELHNRNRPLKSGGETYDVILQNLKNIRDNIKERYFRVLIRLNVTEETTKNTKEYFEMLEKEFSKDKRFLVYIQGVERHNEVRFEEMQGNYLENHEVIESMYDLCIEKKIMTSTLKMLAPGDLMCKAMHHNSIFINSKCEIYKCDMDMQPDHISYMGSLFDSDKIELRGEKYDYWKKIMNKLDYCDDCVLLPLCCGLKCPYYNTLNPKERCELYNNLPLVNNAIKTYAQHNKYELVEL